VQNERAHQWRVNAGPGPLGPGVSLCVGPVFEAVRPKPLVELEVLAFCEVDCDRVELLGAPGRVVLTAVQGVAGGCAQLSIAPTVLAVQEFACVTRLGSANENGAWR
jgi:hypothetical protein